MPGRGFYPRASERICYADACPLKSLLFLHIQNYGESINPYVLPQGELGDYKYIVADISMFENTSIGG